MKIQNLAGDHGIPLSKAAAHFRTLSDPELIAQELVQKGAIHALETLRARRLSPEAMIENLQVLARVITDECRRRGLPIADELET